MATTAYKVNKDKKLLFSRVKQQRIDLIDQSQVEILILDNSKQCI